jgi:hypothetical protein
MNAAMALTAITIDGYNRQVAGIPATGINTVETAGFIERILRYTY